MRHCGRTIGLHEDAALARSREAFLEVWADDRGRRGAAEKFQERQAAIARLEVKSWRGHPVFRLQCAGPFGRGPHVVWVPERVLWSLLDLRFFLCAYHR